MEYFIRFILDLVSDEFYQYLSPVPIKYYFLNGGCLELAKVLKHYYPEGQYVLNEEKNHIAFLYQEQVYDANGIAEKSNWEIVNDINKLEDYYGNKDIYFEHLLPHQAILNELNEIDMSIIKKLSKTNNEMNFL